MLTKVVPYFFAALFSLLIFWVMTSFQAEISLGGREVPFSTWVVNVLISFSPILLVALVGIIKRALSKRGKSD